MKYKLFNHSMQSSWFLIYNLCINHSRFENSNTTVLTHYNIPDASISNPLHTFNITISHLIYNQNCPFDFKRRYYFYSLSYDQLSRSQGNERNQGTLKPNLSMRQKALSTAVVSIIQNLCLTRSSIQSYTTIISKKS